MTRTQVEREGGKRDVLLFFTEAPLFIVKKI